MKRKLILFWSSFFTLSSKQCQKLGLSFQCNVHGDLINLLGCRSVWTDEHGNEYRCSELIPEFDYVWPGVLSKSNSRCDFCRLTKETVMAISRSGVVHGHICKACAENYLYCFSCGSKCKTEYELSHVSGEFVCNNCTNHSTK